MNALLQLSLAAWALGSHLPHTAGQDAGRDAKHTPPRVLIIGDSISAGYTPFVKSALAGECTVQRIPMNGQHTGVGLELLDDWLGAEPWDLIHFNWGLHDLAYRPASGNGLDKAGGTLTSTLPVYESQLDQLVQRLKKTGSRLIFATTTPVPPGEPGRFAGDARRYNEVALRVMRRHGVAVNDLYSAVAEQMPELATRPGNVHFKPAGSQRLAAQVAASIRRAWALPEDAAAQRPNVVIVLADDLGWTDLGCTGSPTHRTPNLDRLAAQGLRFTQAYASCAVCSPTRAALMTGRLPARLGITDWIHHVGPEADEARAAGQNLDGFDRPRGRPLLTPRNRVWLEDAEDSMAELVARQGYATAYVGKWHLGGEGHLPEQQGFDFNAGGCAFGQPPSYFDPFANQRWDGIPGLPGRTPGEYLTRREADEAVSFVRAHADRPFLLYYAPYAVHSPIQAPADEVEEARSRLHPPHDNPTYAVMVEEVDRAVGRIADELRRQGLLDNTLLVFTSDNGGAVHFDATDNRPLRKGKGFPYEGGLRVPCIVHWPAMIREARVVDTPISSVDLFPTVASAVGAAPLAELDGRSLLADFGAGSDAAGRDRAGSDTAPGGESDGAGPRALVWHFPHYWWGTNIRPYSILREGPWKLITHHEDGRAELYHLGRDLSEEEDLAATEPERVAAMRGRLRELLEGMGAKMPAPNPEFEGGPR